MKSFKKIAIKTAFFSFFIILLSSITALTIHAQNLNVSATVPPSPSDFQFAFTSDGQTSVPQNTTLSYQITYGSQVSAGVSTTTTLVADYSADTAPDNSDVLDYVIGSASNGYGGATPVVDLTQHTITWTIPNFPAGTINQTVTFQLRTNSNYTGATPVNFTIRAKMSNQYVTMPDQTITQTYQFDQSLVTPTPTPTATPMPTAVPTNAPTSANPNPTQSAQSPTSTPNPTSTPLTVTPTPQPTGPEITNISFPDISASSAAIQITTSTPATIAIDYGISPNALSHTSTTNDFQKVSTLMLTGLKADTIYYFKITVTDQSGQTASTEIFTFQTAKVSLLPISLNGSAVISSGGTVLLSEILEKAMTPGFAILTNDTGYEITVSQPGEFTSLEVVVQKETPLNTVSFVQKESGDYVAHLKTLGPGTYELFLKTTDADGNVTQQKIANLKVTPRLSVFDKDTNEPIADARIFLYYYDTKSDSYKPITQDFFGSITNPAYTNAMGEINTILPPGKYRVDASALLYDKRTVDFTLGAEDGQEFPRIFLTKNSFNIGGLLQFGKDILLDTTKNTLSTLRVMTSSVRLFHVIAVTTTGSFALIGLLLFFLKSHLNFKHIPVFLLFGLHVLVQKHKGKYLFGSIVDEEQRPLSHVQIHIEDAKTKKILTHITTMKTGKFYFLNDFSGKITLIFTKDGYALSEVSLDSDDSLSKDGLKICLIKESHVQTTYFSFLTDGMKTFGGMLFETCLVISIIIELLFFFMYGFLTTLPFLLISLFNIILWVFYLRERHSQL